MGWSDGSSFRFCVHKNARGNNGCSTNLQEENRPRDRRTNERQRRVMCNAFCSTVVDDNGQDDAASVTILPSGNLPGRLFFIFLFLFHFCLLAQIPKARLPRQTTLAIWISAATGNRLAQDTAITTLRADRPNVGRCSRGSSSEGL